MKIHNEASNIFSFGVRSDFIEISLRIANKIKKEESTILKSSKADGINNKKETKKRAEKLLSLLSPFRLVIKFVTKREATNSNNITLFWIPFNQENEVFEVTSTVWI